MLAAGIDEAYQVMAAALHHLLMSTSPTYLGQSFQHKPMSRDGGGSATAADHPHVNPGCNTATTTTSSSNSSSIRGDLGGILSWGIVRKLLRATHRHLVEPLNALLGPWWRQDNGTSPCSTGSTTAATSTTTRENNVPGLGELSFCPLLNSSVCPASVSVLSSAVAGARVSGGGGNSCVGCCCDHGLLVVVYNPLAWPREELVRVPVGDGEAGFTVAGMLGF